MNYGYCGRLLPAEHLIRYSHKQCNSSQRGKNILQKIYSRTILKTKGSLPRKIQSGRGTMKKVIYCALCVIAGAAAALLLCRFSAAVKCEKKEKTAVPRSAEPSEKAVKESGEKIITGYGYIRGRSCTTLRNKYGAYVSKVHFYSDRPVKKGDCILEYDDFDLRQKIVAAENAIANLEKENLSLFAFFCQMIFNVSTKLLIFHHKTSII